MAEQQSAQDKLAKPEAGTPKGGPTTLDGGRQGARTKN